VNRVSLGFQARYDITFGNTLHLVL